MAEFRADSPYPFRVPKTVLDAVVGALTAAKRPLRTGDVRSVVRKRLGETPADYQLHTCLRLLATGGLIRLRGQTYSAIEPKSLRRQVGKLWRELPGEPDG